MMRSLLRKIRFVLFILIALIAYVGSSFFLFDRGSVAAASTFILIFLGALPFLNIEIKKTSLSRIILTLIILTSIQLILRGRKGAFTLLGILIFHVGIFFSLWSVSTELTNRKKPNHRALFNGHGFIYTACSTLSMILVAIERYPYFQLTCEQVYIQYNTLLNHFKAPIIMSYHNLPLVIFGVIVYIGIYLFGAHIGRPLKKHKTIGAIGILISMFGIFGIVLFLSVQRLHDGQKLTVLQDQTVLQRKENFEQQYNVPIEQFLGIGSQENQSQLQSGAAGSGLLGKFDTYKQILIDQVISDNTEVNQGVCDYILKQIDQRYTNPTFQYSVIALLFVVLFPLARVITIILSHIAWIIFLILRHFRRYRLSKLLRKTEEFE